MARERARTRDQSSSREYITFTSVCVIANPTERPAPRARRLERFLKTRARGCGNVVDYFDDGRNLLREMGIILDISTREARL